VALWLALAQHDVEGGIIDRTVSYAWTGLGSSFGPPLLCALWWRGTTRWGALAGMVGGITSTIVWKNVDVLGRILDIKAAPFLISLVLVVTVSLATRKTDP